MRGDPTFSVVIPTYNYGHFLATALASVLEQDRDDVEIIVVDDASRDNTPEVVATYADDIRYVRLTENVGAAAAWATGLRLARGTYVCKLDADDWQLPGWFDLVEHAFTVDPRLGLVAGGAYVLRDDLGTAHLESVTARDELLTEAELRHRLLRKFFFRMPAVALRRAVTEGQTEPRPDLRLPHDWEYFLRVSNGWKGYLTAEPLGVYRVHGGSLTVTSRTRKRLQHDMITLLDATRDPSDPAYVRPDERSTLAIGVADSYLGSIGPRLSLREPVEVLRHLSFALRIAASEDVRLTARVMRLIARGAWQKFVSSRRRSRVDATLLLPSRGGSSQQS